MKMELVPCVLHWLQHIYKYIKTDILWQTCYGKYILADMSQQMYYGRYPGRYILRQMYYSRYNMADILQQIPTLQHIHIVRLRYYVRNITAYIYVTVWDMSANISAALFADICRYLEIYRQIYRQICLRLFCGVPTVTFGHP